LNKKYNVKGQPNSSILLQNTNNLKIVNQPTNPITFPIKNHMNNVIPYQREAFEIIKDKFELIEELPKDQSYEIVSIYSETTCTNCACDNHTNVLPFLRNLFLERMNYKMISGKQVKIYN
jgi:hypothetical protein